MIWRVDARFNYKIEGLNTSFSDVYVLPLTNPNLESIKCMCVVNLYYVVGSQQTLECIAKEAEIQYLSPLDDFDQSLLPYDVSRVSGEGIVHVASDMKSTLVSTEVMARYLLAKEKLKKNLKLKTLEDHQWHLRSLDHNSVGVVKVCCVECCEEFGSTIEDHTKNTIHNLFSKIN